MLTLRFYASLFSAHVFVYNITTFPKIFSLKVKFMVIMINLSCSVHTDKHRYIALCC